jgi:hypothetical protein
MQFWWYHICYEQPKLGCHHGGPLGRTTQSNLTVRSNNSSFICLQDISIYHIFLIKFAVVFLVYIKGNDYEVAGQSTDYTDKDECRTRERGDLV